MDGVGVFLFPFFFLSLPFFLLLFMTGLLDG